MKKIILSLLVVLVAHIIKAQTITVSGMPDKPYKQTIDSLFSNINKSAVTSGVWYDRAYPIANLNRFNQYAADTAAGFLFEQAYFQLYHATYSNTTLVSPDDFAGIKQYYHNQNKVPVGLINYTYQYLDTNALANNLIYESGGLYYDTPGRPTSPWHTNQLLMGAVLADSLVDQGNGIDFYMAEAFFMQNGSKTVATIQVDFNDGAGLRTFAFGNTLNIGYSTSGFKTVKFVVTFNDSSQQTTYASFKYRIENNYNMYRLACPNRITEIKGFQSVLTFQGYDEAAPRKGRGDVTIFYHDSNNCDTVLRKPIIVIDGFDPGSERTAYFNPNDTTNTLYNQMFYRDAQNQRKNLVDSLNILGYDVVMLDFPKYKIGTKTISLPLFNINISIDIMLDGGADYIERNAYVLVHLIDSLNAKLAQHNITEQLVIIGPSMGGLISRYALAYMENNSMPHNTRLWVSFDAPHLGANIPLGDQKYIDYFADLSAGAKRSRDEKLASTAAKQMLRAHYTVSPCTLALTGSFGAVGFRNRFQTALDNMGWPTNLRKIALVNGSINGQTIGNGCEIALQSETRLSNIFNLRVARGKVRFMPAIGNSCKVFEGSHAPFSDSYFSISNPSNQIASIDNAPGALFNT